MQLFTSLAKAQNAADSIARGLSGIFGESLGRSSFAPLRVAGNLLSHVDDASHENSLIGKLAKGAIYASGATLLPVIGPVLPVLAAPLVSKLFDEGPSTLLRANKRRRTETSSSAVPIPVSPSAPRAPFAIQSAIRPVPARTVPLASPSRKRLYADVDGNF
jgi:hypothetical protein